MRFLLFENGAMVPFHKNPHGTPYGFNAFVGFGDTKEQSFIDAENVFLKYIVDNNLDNHFFIQWENDTAAFIPCMGSGFGDWECCIWGLFRTQDEISEFKQNNRCRSFKEIYKHI